MQTIDVTPHPTILYEIIAAGAVKFIWVYSSCSTPFVANCRAADVKNNLINALKADAIIGRASRMFERRNYD